MDKQFYTQIDSFTNKASALTDKYNDLIKKMQGYRNFTNTNEVYAVLFAEIFNDKELANIWFNLLRTNANYTHADTLYQQYPSEENQQQYIDLYNKREQAITLFKQSTATILEEKLDNKLANLKTGAVEQRTETIQKLFTQGQEILRKYGFTLLQSQMLVSKYNNDIKKIAAENPDIDPLDAEDQAYGILTETIKKHLAESKQPFVEEDYSALSSVVCCMSNLLHSQEALSEEQKHLRFQATKSMIKYNRVTTSQTPRADYYLDALCGSIFYNTAPANLENYTEIMAYVNKHIKADLPYNFSEITGPTSFSGKTDNQTTKKKVMPGTKPDGLSL